MKASAAVLDRLGLDLGDGGLRISESTDPHIEKTEVFNGLHEPRDKLDNLLPAGEPSRMAD